ncbi:hypothetical protein [Amycolatopsis sp. cmx-4-68]|uniref:hypothetical protein n=1 Tax=Amycolatopsis sp. cmx-4-68 TaxID=2790938 RepID=UPI0039799678
MAARMRFPPVRIAAFLVVAAAAATISGPGEAAGRATPVPPSPAVPPAALLPAAAIPGGPAARDEFDVATESSSSDRSDATGCTAVVHGRLLGPDPATGRGFQSAVPGGQFSELLARTPHPPGLAAWTARARHCARVTVDDQDVPTVSTLTLTPAPDVPGATTETLSYQQVLTLPGQPAGLPGLRLRTVAIAADDVLLVLRDAGPTDLDLDTLAVTAWQHAVPRLGR